MNQNELHRVLEETTKRKWRREDLPHFSDPFPPSYLNKDTLLLIDDKYRRQLYFSDYTLRDQRSKEQLRKFARETGLKLLPVIKVELDYFTPINFYVNFGSIGGMVAIKPSGSITLQPSNPHNPMTYTLWNKISSKVGVKEAINDFISDATAMSGEYDTKTNEYTLKLSKKVGVGPLSIKLEVINLKVLKGSASFDLRKDKVKYRGWQFDGELELIINVILIDDPKDNIFKTENVSVSQTKYYPYVIGGILFIGACLFSSGVVCGAGAIGGTLGALST